MPVITDEQFDEPLTTTEAAQRLRVAKSTISKWVARGHLAPFGLNEQGRPVYRFGDLIECADERGWNLLIQPVMA